MTTETTRSDAEVDAELAEQAEFMETMLADEIAMLREIAKEHDAACGNRYGLELEIAALEGARLYFAHKSAEFRADAPAPEEPPAKVLS
jgi:hypothetical protein